MKRNLSKIGAILLSIIALVQFTGIFTAFAATYADPSGSGTTDDPYIITNVNQLDFIRQNADKIYLLGNDLDMSSIANFVPLPVFSGRFDGNGKTISNLTIYAEDNEGAFFYGLSGMVTNLTFKNANVTTTAGNAGIVASTSNGVITHVNIIGGSVNMSIRKVAVGSITGRMTNGTLSNCKSSATVTNASMAGGLVGISTGGYIVNSYATGNVTGSSYAGGLVGQETNTQIIRSFFTGTVNGTTSSTLSGGLIGQRTLNANSTSGDIDTCYWDVNSSEQNQGAVINNTGAPAEITGLEGMTGIQIPTTINVTPSTSPKQIAITTTPSTATVSGIFSTDPYYSGVTVTSSGAVTAVYNGTYPVNYTLTIGPNQMVIPTNVTVSGAQNTPSTQILKIGSTKLLLNGAVISTVNNTSPTIVNSILYVPLRTAAQAMGMTVTYDYATNSTIAAIPNGNYVSTTASSNTIYIYNASGSLIDTKYMPGVTLILNESTYVPLNFFSLGFNYQTETRTYTGGDTYVLISNHSPQWSTSQVSDLIEDAMDKI